MAKYYDEIIFEALRKRRKVSLFLCKDEEGGFGIKVEGKVVARNFPWECFEMEVEDD